MQIFALSDDSRFILRWVMFVQRSRNLFETVHKTLYAAVNILTSGQVNVITIRIGVGSTMTSPTFPSSINFLTSKVVSVYANMSKKF